MIVESSGPVLLATKQAPSHHPQLFFRQLLHVVYCEQLSSSTQLKFLVRPIQIIEASVASKQVDVVFWSHQAHDGLLRHVSHAVA